MQDHIRHGTNIRVYILCRTMYAHIYIRVYIYYAVAYTRIYILCSRIYDTDAHEGCDLFSLRLSVGFSSTKFSSTNYCSYYY
jgi:hypothetical protein